MALPPVYTQRVFAGVATVGSPVESVIVPPGLIWSLVSIDCASPDGFLGVAYQGFNAYVLAQPGDRHIPVFTRSPVWGPDSYHWEGRVVLEAGDALVVETLSQPISCHATVYALSLP